MEYDNHTTCTRSVIVHFNAMFPWVIQLQRLALRKPCLTTFTSTFSIVLTGCDIHLVVIHSSWPVHLWEGQNLLYCLVISLDMSVTRTLWERLLFIFCNNLFRFLWTSPIIQSYTKPMCENWRGLNSGAAIVLKVGRELTVPRFDL